MVEKKVAKKAQKKTIKKTPAKKTSKAEKTKSSKTIKSKAKKISDDSDADMGIVIVDDDIHIDQEKVNEERRAYLEEARSQEAYD